MKPPPKIPLGGTLVMVGVVGERVATTAVVSDPELSVNRLSVWV